MTTDPQKKARLAAMAREGVRYLTSIGFYAAREARREAQQARHGGAAFALSADTGRRDMLIHVIRQVQAATDPTPPRGRELAREVLRKKPTAVLANMTFDQFAEEVAGLEGEAATSEGRRAAVVDELSSHLDGSGRQPDLDGVKERGVHGIISRAKSVALAIAEQLTPDEARRRQIVNDLTNAAERTDKIVNLYDEELAPYQRLAEDANRQIDTLPRENYRTRRELMEATYELGQCIMLRRRPPDEVVQRVEDLITAARRIR